MATSLVFTDTTGAVTLTNGKPVPGDRFDDWTPYPHPVGPLHAALGTGDPHLFEFRTDYCVRFALSKIPNSKQSDADRLVEHLLKTGSVTVNTGDSASRFYTCTINVDGERPALELADKTLLEYTLRLDLRSTGTSRMLCTYP